MLVAYTFAMNRFAQKLLALCCGVLLVLPPSWCSAVPAFQTHQPTVARACCDLCHCVKREAPTERIPEPTSPTKCCCYEKDSLKPPSPDRYEAQFVCLGFVPPPTDAVCARGCVGDLEAPAPARSQRLHLLKCVWLC